MDADYISHVQLSELSPIEQARLIEKLTADGETSREIADRFDRSRYWVSNRKRLTNLPESVQTFVHKGDISVRQALALEKAYRLKRTDSDSKGARRINVQDLVERAKDGTLTSDDIRERVNGLESDDNPAIFYLMRLGEKLKFGVTKDVEKRKKAHQSETNGHVKVLRAKECASRSLDL
jgi:ParB-like chromosome segregation protein Spo0J